MGACNYPSTGAVSSLDDLQRAVVRIEAEGTFVDPEFGLAFNVPSTGSGFIIDPSGITVTSNHVVAGSAFLNVWVSGEHTPRNARVLGLSECSDLAVIDIDGDGFAFLDWHPGNAEVGTEVYAAGFPLGDPEFTLTRGIVSKANADGDTAWASLENVLEHDATLNPGNSGGPLVDASARVLGINFAASTQAANQNFSIMAEDAIPIVEQLRSLKNVESVGINGAAFGTADGELAGIWTSSVHTGSVAERAGVLPGDLIMTLEGILLAQDLTMADYCDVLRSHASDELMSILVLRPSTGELLDGQLNGESMVVIDTIAPAETTDPLADCEGLDTWLEGIQYASTRLFGRGMRPDLAIQDMILDPVLLDQFDPGQAASIFQFVLDLEEPGMAKTANHFFVNGFSSFSRALEYNFRETASNRPGTVDISAFKIENSLSVAKVNFAKGIEYLEEVEQECN